MGFNLAVLLLSDDGEVDLRAPSVELDAAAKMLSTLSPRTRYDELGLIGLDAGAFPARGDINLAAFQGGCLVATRDAVLFNPTKLAPKYVNAARTVTLLTQQSTFDMFAYARWVEGQLIRSISINPVGRIWESVGEPEAFETPFWNGERPVDVDYPLPFHPLDLSDAALRATLRLHFEGNSAADLLDPSEVSLWSYRPRPR